MPAKREHSERARAVREYEGGPRKDPSRGIEERLQLFVDLYLDARNPSLYLNATACAQRIFPDADEKVARSYGHRYLDHPKVRRAIEERTAPVQESIGMTVARYIQRCMANEEMLLQRGKPGDAGAAVKYGFLVGKAAGLLIERSEDVTPPERRIGSIQQVLEMAERLKRLSEPNPVPQIAAAVDAEYEILSPETNAHDGTTEGRDEGPCHGDRGQDDGQGAGDDGAVRAVAGDEGVRDRPDPLPGDPERGAV